MRSLGRAPRRALRELRREPLAELRAELLAEILAEILAEPNLVSDSVLARAIFNQESTNL
jgi:hypothetical protein